MIKMYVTNSQGHNSMAIEIENYILDELGGNVVLTINKSNGNRLVIINPSQFQVVKVKVK